jgi:hypothetical protein
MMNGWSVIRTKSRTNANHIISDFGEADEFYVSYSSDLDRLGGQAFDSDSDLEPYQSDTEQVFLMADE